MEQRLNRSDSVSSSKDSPRELDAGPRSHGVAGATAKRHSKWVKNCHWTVSVSFAALAFSGFLILMCHPRLYWGNVGNDLTPALIELPLSRNYKHQGWTNERPFFNVPNSPRSAARTYEIFNQNSWGRSLHFLAAWVLVGAGLTYLTYGVMTGHFAKNFLPATTGVASSTLQKEKPLQFHTLPPLAPPRYSRLQRLSYCVVVFVLFPLAGITGLAMSPAVAASIPLLPRALGGHQSSRTIHFFLFLALVTFLMVHVVMVIRSGFRKQIRGMTWGDIE